MLDLNFSVNEVASLTVRAVALCDKDAAFFRFVFGVDLLISSQFMRPMGKFAFLFIGAKSILHEFLAELRLFFIGMYRRFLMTFRRLSRRARAGCGERTVHLFGMSRQI